MNIVTPRSKKNLQGFTLIELLVVIAIIAILAAILFPVFARARENARKASCMSNLKQIGLGVLQYQQDYDEKFPMLHFNDSRGQELRWFEAVSPYMKTGDKYVGGSGYTSGAGGVWTCPSLGSNQPAVYGAHAGLFREGLPYATPAVSVSIAVLDKSAETVMVIEKGQNDGNSSWLQFQNWEGNWTASGGGTEANGYTYPDHIDIRADHDCDYGASAAASSYGNWNGCSMMPRYRHNGTSNMLYSDGHVKAMTRGSVNWYKNIYVAGAYQHGGVY